MSTSARMHLWPLSVAAPRPAPALALPVSPLPPEPAAPAEPQPKPVQQRRTWLNPLPRQVPVVDRLSKLPLELVYLLLSFLDPPSLLALSCASRPWANLLRCPTSHTHERTKRLWAQARLNARVPVLESDLAGGDEGEIAHEVLLARLLGGWACQVCGGAAAQDEDVDFDARVRLCSTCRASMLATTQQLSDAYFHLHPHTFNCVFRTSTHYLNVNHPQPEYHYFVPDVLAVSAYMYYLEAEALGRGEKAAPVVGEHAARRRALRMQVRRDAYKLRGWWKVRDKDRYVEERRCRARRQTSIFARLEDLGFENPDYPYLFYDDVFCEPLLLSAPPSETSSQKNERERLNDDLDRFLGTSDPLGEQEWRDWRPRIVAWVHEQRREQRGYARVDARADLARLHALVVRGVGGEAGPLVPPLNSLLRLPSLEAGPTFPEEYEVDAALPAAIADAVEAMRTDRLVLLDRLARTLLAEGDPLPPSILLALSSSPSPFIDRDPRVGVEPAYLAIPSADVDAVLSRATALFRCGICDLVAPFAQLVPHVHASQGSRAPPRCIVASAQVRVLVRGAVGPAASVNECEARGRVWEAEGRTIEVGEDGGRLERSWRESGLTWCEVMQHGLSSISTLAIGSALAARSSPPGALERTDLDKDVKEVRFLKKVRILGSFDLDHATVTTYRCE